ncbi:hypothetical protein EXIGLDRAFT_695577 [Exidia glandulosa HHB12029]|uniref:Uncharacterized protein n=1 Tax=Exidia glandulosa HHB12029 TaxID=1314781 RepID=A0A165FT50_EXIGL|nr:hypothetical protein EXIGLDRAFT_695577 [Exidia glandulosa HHB12029]
MAPAYAAPTHGEESDDSDDERMPAMIQDGAPPRVDYTRPANDDERPLFTEDDRADIFPNDWKAAQCTQWFEVNTEDRRMAFIGKKRATELRGEQGWIVYVDYEKRRILHFSAHSGIEKEHPELPPGERRLRDGVVKWCKDEFDYVGQARASRSIWRALKGGPHTRPQAKQVPDRDRNQSATAALALGAGPSTIATPNAGAVVKESVADPVRDLAQPRPPSPMQVDDAPAVGQDAPSTAEDSVPPTDLPLYDPPLPPRNQNEFKVGQHVVTRQQLETDTRYAAWFIWEIQEATFRSQMRDLDRHVLQAMDAWNDETAAERETIWQDCWGGKWEGASLVPSYDMAPPLLDSKNFLRRAGALVRFHRLVSAWPRSQEVKSTKGMLMTEDGFRSDRGQEIESSTQLLHCGGFGRRPITPSRLPSFSIYQPDLGPSSSSNIFSMSSSTSPATVQKLPSKDDTLRLLCLKYDPARPQVVHKVATCDSCKKTQAQTLGLQKHPNDEGSFHNAGRWYWKCPTRACRGVVYSTAQRSEEERAEHEAIYMRRIAEREQVQKMRKGQKEHKAELEDTARKLKDTERKLKDTERELANAQSAARKARIDELSKSLDAIVTPKTSRKRASSTSGSSSIQSKRVKSEPRTDSSSPLFAKKSEGGTSPATSSLGIDSSPTPARAFRATLAKYKASGGALAVSSPTKAKASPKTAATKSKVPIGAKKAPVASSSQIPVIEIFSSDDDEIVAGTSGEDDDYTFADDEEAPPQFYSP